MKQCSFGTPKLGLSESLFKNYRDKYYENFEVNPIKMLLSYHTIQCKCLGTFFPFLVGLTDRMARSLNARLSTCRTVGSLAICMATM